MKKMEQILDNEKLPATAARQVFPKVTPWRAKAFVVDGAGNWLDKGAGSAQIVREGNSYTFVVSSDPGQKNVLSSDLALGKDFRLESGCIINWIDGPSGAEIAVSFKTAESAREALEMIQGIQHKEDSKSLYEQSFSLEEPLPPVKLENVEKIEGILSAVGPSQPRKDKVIYQLAKNYNKYLLELATLFEVVEDLEAADKLLLFFRIMKTIIGFNSQSLIELLMSDKFYLTTFGFLEYDSTIDIPRPEFRYRAFFKSKARFINTTKIDDDGIVRKIQLNYRLIFLRDTATASWIDESTVCLLNNLIISNCQDILNYVFSHEPSVPTLLSSMQDGGVDQRLAGLSFLLDICNSSKTLQTDAKHSFFERLLDSKLVDLLLKTMVSKDEVLEGTHKDFGVPKLELIKVNAAEILINCIQILPLKVKTILLSEEQKANNYKFLSLLVTLLAYSPIDGLKFCICEFYKSLLDPESKDLKNEFFDVFYDKLMQKLVDAIISEPPGGSSGRESGILAKNLMLELLTFCVRSHGSRIRYYVLHNPVLQSLLPLLKHSAKSLRLSFLRLFRALVGSKEEPIYRFICKNDMFAPIFELLSQQRRDGLIRSAVFELFNFVASQNLKTLICYLAEKHKERVEQFASLPPFKGLRGRFCKLGEELTSGTRLTETAVSALCKRPYMGDGGLVAKSGGAAEVSSKRAKPEGVEINANASAVVVELKKMEQKQDFDAGKTMMISGTNCNADTTINMCGNNKF